MTSGIFTKFVFALVATSMPAALQPPQPSQPQQDRSTRTVSPGKQNGTGNGQSRPAPPNPQAPQVQPPKPPPPNSGSARPQVQPPRPGGGNGNQPRPNPPRPNPPRPNPPRPNRPPQWGRPPQGRPSYQFRPTDRDYLRRFYSNHLRAINMGRRPFFAAGGYFPYGDIGYLSPVPLSIYGYLPPPPPGYNMGYFDGYVVVYDPLTYFIANLIDLVR
jgi:hypothetical protein